MWHRSLPGLVLLVALGGSLAPHEARAGGYTVTDVVDATQRGAPRELVEQMARQPAEPWSIDHFLTLRLLRSGVSPDVIRIMSGGAHPTRDEIAAGSEPGEGWTPPTGGIPWQLMVGRPVRVELRDGTVAEGDLLAVTSKRVVLGDEAGEVRVLDLELTTVANVRRPAPDGLAGAPAPAAPTPPLPDVAVTLTPALPAPGPNPWFPEPEPEPVPVVPRGPVMLGPHQARWNRGGAMMTAGVGTAAGAIIVLSTAGADAGDEGNGLRIGANAILVGGALTIGAGSLVQRDALIDAGGRADPAWGIAGLSASGLGALGLGIGWGISGETSQVNVPATALLLTGGAFGFVQSSMNRNARDDDRVRVTGIQVAPSPEGSALAVTGRW
jgi:hypothetical protein